MSTFIVAGSPREGMFSDRMAQMYRDMTGGKLVYLRRVKINPCHACEYCKEINIGECIQRDDMTELYKDFRDADTVAIFSPIYWWQVTAQTKLLIDRLYALSHDEWKDKNIVVVINGESEEDDKEYEILHSAFSEMMNYVGAKLFYLGVGTPDEETFNSKLQHIKEELSLTL